MANVETFNRVRNLRNKMVQVNEKFSKVCQRVAVKWNGNFAATKREELLWEPTDAVGVFFPPLPTHARAGL
jgi:hypothetical protein